MSFNPLNYPLCFCKPQRLTDVVSWHEHIPFAFAIMQMQKPKTFVELGTHKGDSYCAFCQAVEALGLDTACYAVDTWEGDEQSGFYGPEILKTLHEYHDPLYEGFSRLIQSRFDQALHHFSDGSIDLLHIDGLHIYDAVLHDFESWLPKMSSHGVVLFHDINVRERNFGVWRLWQDLKIKYPNFEFRHGNGLGVLATGAEIPEEVLAFFLIGEQDPVGISKFFSYLGNTITLQNQVQREHSHLLEVTSAQKTRDTQITHLEQHSKNLENIIADRDGQISSLEHHSKDLENIIVDRESQISSLEQHAKNLERIIADRDSQISSLEQHAKNLERIIHDKESKITEISHQLQSMQESMVWQLLMKFHTSIVERILPQSTHRRRYYDLGINGGRIVINDGWRKCYIALKNQKQKKRNDAKLIDYNKVNKNLEKSNLEIIGLNAEKNLITRFNRFLDHPNGRVTFPKYEKPLVSIIILTFNNAPYTHQCLESIVKFSDVPYEMILVDNGSTDNTRTFLTRVDNATIIINDQNLGFVQGCNDGARQATGEYVLFLNNDTIVTEQWLSLLLNTFESHRNCGAVGCKLVWPNGKLQEAGSIIFKNGSALGYGRGDNPLKPEYNYVRECDFCSGACLLVRTDIFKGLKGFDERYIPAYYEDADLCLSIQNLGYTVLYQPKVTIFHHEFTSSSKERAIESMINNQSKFIEKWQEYLKKKEINSPDTILNARDIKKQKKILVLDDRIPASNQGSGYPRANALLKYFVELGFKITFFPLDNSTPWQPYTSQFQDLGVEVFFGDDLKIKEFSAERSHFYDVIIISRPHNFDRSFQIIKTYFPNAYLIYDAEALFSTREILKAKSESVTLNDNQIRELRNKEFELMKTADLIITVSDNEREIIKKSTGLDNILVFGYPVQVQNSISGYKERKNILFVGSFLALDGPNDDAILYFVREIWPEVQKQLSCKLYIVGINPPDRIQKLNSESIIVTGFVPDIGEYYDNCRVFIVPHRYAAGIPLKLIEAMSYGIPSVVSELIASQLNLLDGKEVFIAADSDEFARKITLLYQNEIYWNAIHQKSIEYITNNCNSKNFENFFQTILEKI